MKQLGAKERKKGNNGNNPSSTSWYFHYCLLVCQVESLSGEIWQQIGGGEIIIKRVS
jgi:hypothetical protein